MAQIIGVAIFVIFAAFMMAKVIDVVRNHKNKE